MPLQLEKFYKQHDKYLFFSDKLKIIFDAMDERYKKAADYYGFNCTGCRDNCCRSLFFHHTLLEYLYIIKGYNELDNTNRITVTNRAQVVCRETDKAIKKNTTVRQMCPLNSDGLCLIYDYRPMICRLHGIPHELKKPGQNAVYGSGCDAFITQCKDKDYFKFDRTPFYMEMARLENDLKQAAGITIKLKMTVARMLIIPGNRHIEHEMHRY